MKPAGWCYKHFHVIFPSKLRSYCRTRNKGKMCKYFTYEIPEWKRGSAANLEPKYTKPKWRKK